MNLEKFDDLRMANGEVFKNNQKNMINVSHLNKCMLIYFVCNNFQITPSIEQFAASWKLDKQCNEPPIFTTMIHATQSAEEKCKAALDSRRSSLR